MIDAYKLKKTDKLDGELGLWDKLAEMLIIGPYKNMVEQEEDSDKWLVFEYMHDKAVEEKPGFFEKLFGQKK